MKKKLPKLTLKKQVLEKLQLRQVVGGAASGGMCSTAGYSKCVVGTTFSCNC
jgi:hypothetical protein